MKEFDIINNVKLLSKSSYIGDDCAYLKELGIVVSQDNLVENVHFNLDWCTFYQLGYKSAAVNISDILASGGEPKYLTTALSINNKIKQNEIDSFYKGIVECAKQYNTEIIGGDTTLSKGDIFISITAIGTTRNRTISSRKNAKNGHVVVVSGEFGKSAAGLKELENGGNNVEFIDAHLMPRLDANFSKLISENINEQYAMMDTSDGLADALFQIAYNSEVTIECKYNCIPHDSRIQQQDVLFGGEDYKLIATVPYEFAKKYNLKIIGKVQVKNSDICLKIDNTSYSSYDELDVFNHFGGINE